MHVGFELAADAELVIDEHAPELGDAARPLVEPRGRTFEPPRRSNVEHEKAIDVAEEIVLRQIARVKHGVLRAHPAVAAHIEVPTPLGRDDAEIFALRLGALARAPGDGRLHLVGRAQSAVTKLDLDGQPDGILHAVTAPSVAHARLHRAQGFGVGVARLETGIHEAPPDGR